MSNQSFAHSPRKLRVYLLYDLDSKDKVKSLYYRLKACNIKPWMFSEDMPAGEWKIRNEQEIRNADCVIVCLSKKFDFEGIKWKEIRIALDKAEEKTETGDAYLIPLLLEPCNIPSTLGDYTAFDYFSKDNAFDDLMRRVLSHKRDLLRDRGQLIESFNYDPGTGSSPSGAANSTYMGSDDGYSKEDETTSGEETRNRKKKDHEQYVETSLHPTFFWNAQRISRLAWSPDGRYIAYGGAHGEIGIQQATTVTTDSKIFHNRHGQCLVTGLAWSPDGLHIASGSSGNSSRLTPSLSCLAWSPDGKLIASHFGHEVQIWDAETGELFDRYKHNFLSCFFYSFAWSPDGNYLASVSGKPDDNGKSAKDDRGIPDFSRLILDSSSRLGE
jgi:WD40 repeat protein